MTFTKTVKLLTVTGGVSLFMSNALAKTNAFDKWNKNWDFLDPESQLKPSASDEDKLKKRIKVSRRIFLIRHGQYNLCKDNDNYGTLTEAGQRQAACTGHRLAHLNIRFDKIISSTMTRAKETSSIILEKLKITSTNLPEIHYTDLLREGHPIDSDPVHRFKPESWEFVDGCRIEAAFRTHCHRASHHSTRTENELIICHANVIRYFVCRALQVNPERWLASSLANGSITEIVFDHDGKVYVRSIGDKGHMEKSLVTFT